MIRPILETNFTNGHLWLGTIYCTMAFIKYGDWMCPLVSAKSL